MRFTFDPRRTAQAAAWLLHQHDGQLTRGKLLKLLYLCDRRSLVETGSPITGDYMVSMDQGPVLSITYDLIKGNYAEPNARAIWGQYVRSVPKTIGVRAATAPPRRGAERAAYDHLSTYDLTTLRRINDAFGALPWEQLSNYTHGLPEWQNPFGSTWPIMPEDILTGENVSRERVLDIAQDAAETHVLRVLFGSE